MKKNLCFGCATFSNMLELLLYHFIILFYYNDKFMHLVSVYIFGAPAIV